MSTNQFNRLIALLERLDEARIPYTMEHSREDAIMILAFAPGEYWEIELLEHGEIDIERYRSNGKIHDESVLQELLNCVPTQKKSPKKAQIAVMPRLGSKHPVPSEK